MFLLMELNLSGPTGPALLPTVVFSAATIAPPSPASPWTIDPERTQEVD